MTTTKQETLTNENLAETLEELTSLHNVKVVKVFGRRKRVYARGLKVINELHPQIIPCILSKCKKVRICYNMETFAFKRVDKNCTFWQKVIDGWINKTGYGVRRERNIYGFTKQEIAFILHALEALLERNPHIKHEEYFKELIKKLDDSDYLYAGKIIEVTT